MCDNNEIVVIVFEPTLQGIMNSLSVVYPVRDDVSEDGAQLLALISNLR